MTRRSFLALFGVGAWRLPAQSSFTQQLWASIDGLYKKTLAHPFLTGLADGTLGEDRFRVYLIQDSLYLRSFAQALNVLSSKAPNDEWSLALTQDALDSRKESKNLHESVLRSYGVTPQEVQRATMAPTCRAYTNHLLASVHRYSFAEGLAAMLPCYWIYWEVGKELKKRGSKSPVFQRWIDQYAGAEYGAVVRRTLDMMNRAPMSDLEHANAKDLFVISARYEYQFWDMAWRLEAWPQ